MSRSRRHSPIIPMTTADSEKAFKRQCARILRSRQKIAVRKGQFDEMVLPERSRDVVETFKGPKDGRQRLDPKDPATAKYLRK